MRAHDLLRLKPHASPICIDAPAWVASALRRAPFVVVRRAEVRGDLVPVGVRGATRAERFPALVLRDDIAETITPEALAHLNIPHRDLPALCALTDVARAAAAFDLVWGPAGSVGFELASGAPVVGIDSDLDIVVRPQPRHTRADLQHFFERIDRLDARIDATIESEAGAVALGEWIASSASDRVLIKTRSGPQLGVFAW